MFLWFDVPVYTESVDHYVLPVIVLYWWHMFYSAAMPYIEPENIDQASLLNDGLEYQMDFSAPHPAL